MARSFIGDTIAELQRRRVFRVATAYALVAFVVLQVAEITFEPLKLPPWSLTALILAVVLLFPLVMGLAWIFDLTPEGIRRTASDPVRGSRRRAYLLFAVVLALDGVLAAYLYRVYAPGVMGGEAAPATLAGPAPAPSGAPANSVAVLPFRDFSPQGDQQYFADGFAVELSNLLGRVEALNVAGRASLFTMREQTADLRRVGELLNVATVLEGSIRREGEAVRVDASLTDANTGYLRWSESFEGPVADIFQIQDRIVAAVAAELESAYGGAPAGERAAGAPASFAAFDRYLEGRDLWRKRTPESLARALEVFRETIELDPGFAPAYAGLADAHLLLATYGNQSMAEALRTADPLIRTALELDGQLSEGFASLGLLYTILGRSAAAEGHLRRAIELNPDNIVAYAWLANLLNVDARLGEQEALLVAALERDPLNLLLNLHLANNHLMRGRVREGFRRYEDTRSIYPTSTLLLRSLASWELSYGRLDAAVDHAVQAATLAPGEPPNRTLLASIFLQLGDLEQAQRSVEQARRVGGENYGVGMQHADYLWRAGRHAELARLAEGMREEQGEELVRGKEAAMPAYWLGRVDLARGEPAAALEHFRDATRAAEELPPLFNVELLTWLAVSHRRAGESAAAGEILRRAERRMEALRLQGLGLPEMTYLESVLAALEDRTELALEHFAAAVDRGFSDSWTAANDARLATLHGEENFRELLAALERRSAEVLARAEARPVAALAP